jgi:hypothetical protein
VKRLTTCLALALTVGTAAVSVGESRGQSPTHGDSVARLLQRIKAGEVVLSGSDNEVLRSVLRELQVPVESQMAVFSRTSMQAGLIRPTNPRVLYFSDSTYVGWVPGGLIEVAAIDPEKGLQFYAFDPQDARDKRRTFVRETSCLRCHGDGMTEQNPALFARSFATTAQGEPLRMHGSDLVTEQTVFERRWGGWYVTGYEGKQQHRGNAFSREREGRLEFSPSEARPLELSAFLDTSRYLAATSDVVALLVFEHQMAVQNSLLKAGQNVRRAFAASSSDDLAKAEALLASSAEDVLDHLLFRNATPLPEGVKGSAAFARAFAADAPRSKQGHALKDLSLRDRLFANRCSFVIHSEQFAALPPQLKDRVLIGLGAALRDDDARGRYAYLEADEKRRILDVLTETLPGARLQLARAAGR